MPLSNIGLNLHGVTRVELRQGAVHSTKWLKIALLGSDGSEVEITAFCGAGFPEIEQIDLPIEETVERENK